MTEHGHTPPARRAALARVAASAPRVDVEAIRREAYERGFSAGFDAGVTWGSERVFDVAHHEGWHDAAEEIGPEEYAAGLVEGWAMQPEDQRSAAFRAGYEAALKDVAALRESTP